MGTGRGLRVSHDYFAGQETQCWLTGGHMLANRAVNHRLFVVPLFIRKKSLLRWYFKMEVR